MLFELLKSNTQPCVAYKMLDYWVDIGRKEDLIRANHDLNVGFSSEDEGGGEIE
jgi:NDP-sugar pyrophosphorylase family protein